ncbi:hypothetical protein Trydic_g17246 [Trypoxylus dichotomus]
MESFEDLVAKLTDEQANYYILHQQYLEFKRIVLLEKSKAEKLIAATNVKVRKEKIIPDEDIKDLVKHRIKIIQDSLEYINNLRMSNNEKVFFVNNLQKNSAKVLTREIENLVVETFLYSFK